MMINYIIGAVAGGVLGYFMIHRLIGCFTGTCSITANPYISTVYGIVLGILIASTFSAYVKQPAPENNAATGKVTYKRITAVEAKTRIDSGDNAVILAVRTSEEYDQGHIPNSILVPNETISDVKPELLPDPNAEILIYCRSGNRSAKAAKKLIALSYTNVYDFGGIID